MSTLNTARIGASTTHEHPPKRVFSGHIEVLQAANGYIINIGRSEGYGHEILVAATVAEVNEIIASRIVAFRLESKT